MTTEPPKDGREAAERDRRTTGCWCAFYGDVHQCSYHEGYEDGYDAALATLGAAGKP